MSRAACGADARRRRSGRAARPARRSLRRVTPQTRSLRRRPGPARQRREHGRGLASGRTAGGASRPRRRRSGRGGKVHPARARPATTRSHRRLAPPALGARALRPDPFVAPAAHAASRCASDSVGTPATASRASVSPAPLARRPERRSRPTRPRRPASARRELDRAYGGLFGFPPKRLTHDRGVRKFDSFAYPGRRAVPSGGEHDAKDVRPGVVRRASRAVKHEVAARRR